MSRKKDHVKRNRNSEGSRREKEGGRRKGAGKESYIPKKPARGTGWRRSGL